MRSLLIAFALGACLVGDTAVFGQSAPYVLAVSPIGSGAEELQRWEPVNTAISEATGLDSRLLLGRDQIELMELLRTRRADAVLLDSVAAHSIGQEISIVPLALVGRRAGVADFLRFVLIVPVSSMRFVGSQMNDIAITVVDTAVFPASPAISTVLCEEIGVEAPVFRFVDTETSILKGVAYGLNEAGVVSDEVLNSTELAEYRRNIRVVAIADPIPSWVLVVRGDSRIRDHRTVHRALEDLSLGVDGTIRLRPVPSGSLPEPGQVLLLDRAVGVWAAGYRVENLQ